MKAQRLKVHPGNPQARLLRQAAQCVTDGGVIAYPTDSHYALGCAISNTEGVRRIRAIRQTGDRHHFALAVRDLSGLGDYAMLGNTDFRFLKSCIPGPFTFVMRATKLVPGQLAHPRKKTVGIRNVGGKVVPALLDGLGGPLITSTLCLGADAPAVADVGDVFEEVRALVDIVLDSGPCPGEPTTVIDMTQTPYALLRAGAGRSPALLEESA